MEFSEFASLPAPDVAAVVLHHVAHPLGVAIPFNGTRRWYMSTFQKDAAELYTETYLERVFCQMMAVMDMMFADGVQTIYTPIIGRDLAQRGQDYMRFGVQAVAQVVSDAARKWYDTRQIEALCYGETSLLPRGIQMMLEHLPIHDDALHRLRYGVFADRPLTDIIAHTLRLQHTGNKPPTAEQVIKSYYGGAATPVSMWIGSDQPTIFDVPLVVHGNTALYFLQFPTLYLDQPSWRRLLYDYVFIRGDQETLYPDNIATEKHITGLGRRQDGYWVPSTT